MYLETYLTVIILWFTDLMFHLQTLLLLLRSQCKSDVFTIFWFLVIPLSEHSELKKNGLSATLKGNFFRGRTPGPPPPHFVLDASKISPGKITGTRSSSSKCTGLSKHPSLLSKRWLNLSTICCLVNPRVTQSADRTVRTFSVRNCSNFIVKHAAEPNRDIGHPSTTINSSSHELPLAGFTTVAQSFPNGFISVRSYMRRYLLVGWHSAFSGRSLRHCRPLRSLIGK